MGAKVTPEQEAAMRLLEMTATIRALAALVGDAADESHRAGASGVAFSCHMLRESLLAYNDAMRRYAAGILVESGLD